MRVNTKLVVVNTVCSFAGQPLSRSFSPKFPIDFVHLQKRRRPQPYSGHLVRSPALMRSRASMVWVVGRPVFNSQPRPAHPGTCQVLCNLMWAHVVLRPFCRCLSRCCVCLYDGSRVHLALVCHAAFLLRIIYRPRLAWLQMSLAS
jgi:hypothetical protein